MSVKKFFFLLLIMTLLLNFTNANAKGFQLSSKSDSTTHNSVAINGDAQLASFSMFGNGSKDTPYVIANLSLSCDSFLNTSARAIGLVISNTNFFFILNNITVKNCFIAIQFNNVSNGVISHSYITQSNYGIVVNLSDNMDIESNYLYNITTFGIDLGRSNSSVVQDNVINSITNTYDYQYGLNLAGDGIYTVVCYSDTIVNNSVSNSIRAGFELLNSHFITLQNNTALNNTWGAFIESFNSRLDNNFFLNNSNGMEIALPGQFNNFYNNTLLYNENYGIYIEMVDSSTFSHNTVSYNQGDGFQMFDSYNNTLLNNTITYNTGNGLDFIVSSNNSISYNVITHNSDDINQTASNKNIFNHNTISPSGTSGSSNSNSNSNSVQTTNTKTVSSSKTKNLSFGIFFPFLAIFSLIIINKKAFYRN